MRTTLNLRLCYINRIHCFNFLWLVMSRWSFLWHFVWLAGFWKLRSRSICRMHKNQQSALLQNVNGALSNHRKYDFLQMNEPCSSNQGCAPFKRTQYSVHLFSSQCRNGLIIHTLVHRFLGYGGCYVLQSLFDGVSPLPSNFPFRILDTSCAASTH